MLDRRSVPVGTLDGVRALLNIDIDDSDEEDNDKSSGRHGNPGHHLLRPDGTHSPSHLAVVTHDNGMVPGGAPKTQSHVSTTDDYNSDLEDGPDPWGDGRGESRWGRRIGVGIGTGSTSGPGDAHVGLALVEALGAWCASVSAYDRLAHLPPGSAAQRAAEAETEWVELERRIARSSLDVQLEEFRYENAISNTAGLG